MIKHLIYKEWLKTRWFALISFLLAAGMVIYIFISVRSGFVTMSGIDYISMLMTYKIQFFAHFRYIPLIIALLIGLSQFVPEVIDKRIKLSLHLPIGNITVIYTMVAYGFCLLLLILSASILLFTGLLSFYLPVEILKPALQTMLPWILGGFTAYFLVSMIALEPIWKFRFLYILVTWRILLLFFGELPIGNAVTLYPVLLALTVVASMAPVYTSHRFNKGEL